MRPLAILLLIMHSLGRLVISTLFLLTLSVFGISAKRSQFHERRLEAVKPWLTKKATLLPRNITFTNQKTSRTISRFTLRFKFIFLTKNFMLMGKVSQKSTLMLVPAGRGFYPSAHSKMRLARSVHSRYLFFWHLWMTSHNSSFGSSLLQRVET